MKKVLPFVFPVAALLIVLFLAYRWYGQRTERTGEVGPFGEGVEIEELTESEREQILRGTGDFTTVNLSVEEGQTANGKIRYEVRDDKVTFSVNADLSPLEAGYYQVWLKGTKSEDMQKAFVLTAGKGGYSGSAAVSADLLPFEVIVTRELIDDAIAEQVILRGTVTKPGETVE